MISRRKSRFAALSLVAVVATLIGCGNSSTTSPLVQALEAISIAADVGAPVVAQISPAAAGFLNLIPGIITAALDVVEGKTPIATASTVTTQLQTVWAQGQSLLPSLSGTDKAIVTGILAALKAGLDLYQQQFPPLTAHVYTTGYAMGFLDSPNPQTAKLKKLSKADKASIARARAHIAAVKAALAAKVK